MKNIPFNKAYCAEHSAEYLTQVVNSSHLSGDGPFTKWCHQRLRTLLGVDQLLLTPSGTDALELAALLLNLKPGDEVIMPSYTFPSSANAFLLRGAVPVFVDIRPDTLNLDEQLLEEATSPRTKAVVPVHYAGVPCEMSPIMDICRARNIAVIEDSAHAIGSKYEGKDCGKFGQMAALSFHETKNISAGEGGAFVANDPEFSSRAEILREKGTNRSQFFRGQIDKYTWVDLGSSFLPSEFQAAVLKAQLESYEFIQFDRMRIWNTYYNLLAGLEVQGYLRRPIVPNNCLHNAHLFYVLLRSLEERTALMKYLGDNGVNTVFHYIPLHDSPAGKRYGRVGSAITETNSVSDRLLRLPLWVGLSLEQISFVVEKIESFFTKRRVQNQTLNLSAG